MGRLIDAKEGKYDTGQLFLHRIFGYRGVILFPWTARVYDRDLHNPSRQSTVTTATSTPTQCTKEASSLRVKAGNSNSSTTTTAQHEEASAAAWQDSSSGTDAQSTSNIGTAKPVASTSTSSTVDSKEVRGKTQTFYQVLIDTRDCPHIVSYKQITINFIYT